LLFNLKEIRSNTARIDSSTRQGNHDEEHQSEETIFFDFIPRTRFRFSGDVQGRFFIERPSCKRAIYSFQEEHHHGKNKNIGEKTKDKDPIDIQSFKHSIGYAGLGLAKG